MTAATEVAGGHPLIGLGRVVEERTARRGARIFPASASATTSMSSVTEPQYVLAGGTSYAP
jgi:hypothetical protein